MNSLRRTTVAAPVRLCRYNSTFTPLRTSTAPTFTSPPARDGGRPQRNFRDSRDSREPREPRQNRAVAAEATPRVYRHLSGGQKDDFHHGRQDRYDPADPPYTRSPRRDLPRTVPDSEFIYGTNVVQAALTAKSRQFYRLYIYAGENREAETKARDRGMARLAESRGIEVVYETDVGLMDSMANSRPHNGYVLECSPLLQVPILYLTESVEGSVTYQKAQASPDPRIRLNAITPIFKNRTPDRHPFLLMLEGISDTGNLGAIMRSAYYLGCSGILLAARKSAAITPLTLKASAGAAEFLPIFTYANVNRLITESKARGWQFFAATPPATKNQMRRREHYRIEDNAVRDALNTAPTVLVMGGEGEGIRNAVRVQCQKSVSIGQGLDTKPLVDSLNVSVAAAILCHGFLAKRKEPTPVVDQEKKKEKRETAKRLKEKEWENLVARYEAEKEARERGEEGAEEAVEEMEEEEERAAAEIASEAAVTGAVKGEADPQDVIPQVAEVEVDTEGEGKGDRLVKVGEGEQTAEERKKDQL